MTAWVRYGLTLGSRYLIPFVQGPVSLTHTAEEDERDVAFRVLEDLLAQTLQVT